MTREISNVRCRLWVLSVPIAIFMLCLLAFVTSAAGQDTDNTTVPVDSWIYPAIERLEARGFIGDAYFGLRPWRTIDCLRMVEEAEQLASHDAPDEDVLQDIKQLRSALRQDVEHGKFEFRIPEIHERLSVVSGTPLNDSFHFAQTRPNDSGRTYASGLNTFTQVDALGHAGPFSGFAQVELQRVSHGQQPDALAQAAVAQVDFTPAGQLGPGTSFLRGRILEAYVALSFHGNQLTAGKQALWWGPARSSATLFTNNAEPINMFRYERTAPFHLPGPLRWLGGIRTELLLGRLSGAQYVHAQHTTFGRSGSSLANQPWIHAEKIAFHPSRSFEFSVSRSVLFAGQGAPFTTRSLFKSYFSSGTGDGDHDPGDRRAAFDARLRINRCVSTYVDTFTEDEPFPLAYIKESAWIAGLSLTCIPHSKKLSLRLEGLLSPHRDILPGFYYFNVHYLSGYTQQRQIIGSWIGREGKGTETWLTWHGASTTLEASVRQMNVAHEFLQGGNLQDLRFAVDRTARGDFGWRAELQGERWNFPLLHSSPRFNGMLTVGLVYRQKEHSK